MSGALAITIDVDGEAGLPDGGRGYEERLSSRSERVYGIRRGLPAMLRVLAEHDVAATFYVPGVTALAHPDAVAMILDGGGHEVAHHGHTHRRPDQLGADEQRAELVDGLDALARFGVRAAGYRAPGWELTPATLALLAELGFAYDSSLMDDDRPYVLENGLVELPVHWSLDDAPFFAASPAGTGLWEAWRRAVTSAAADERAITITLHPEILGRPQRLDVLRRLLDHAAALGLPTATHGELATRFPPPALTRAP